MTFSLDIDEYYNIAHVGKCDKIPSKECTKLLEDYFSRDGGEGEEYEITYYKNSIIFDELHDIEINGMDCPVQHELTITKIN